MDEERVELVVLLYLAGARKHPPTAREVLKTVGSFLTLEKGQAARVQQAIHGALKRVEQAGEVARHGATVELSRRGQRRCSKELGVRLPNRTGWRKLKKYLLARALAPSARPSEALKRLSKPADVAGLVLNEGEQVFSSRIPTATQVADLIAWRELGGDPKTKASWTAARRLLLARKLGVPASTPEEALLQMMAARLLGVSRATPRAIEGRVLANWSKKREKNEKKRQTRSPNDSFAERALAAAADPRTERFGDNKAFIASVFETYKRRNNKASFEEFGSALVKAHLDGALRLARADLVPAMDRELVGRSELTYENATFHFLEVP